MPLRASNVLSSSFLICGTFQFYLLGITRRVSVKRDVSVCALGGIPLLGF